MGGCPDPGKPVSARIGADINVGGTLPERRLLAHVRLDPLDAHAMEEGPGAVLDVGVQLPPE
eukprot:10983383-Alexandrium_andersonii.AAC.1